MPITKIAADDRLLTGFAALMRQAMSGADPFRFVDFSAYNPNDAHALMGLSVVFQLTGNREMGLELQEKALKIRQHYRLSSADKDGIRMLAIVSPGEMMQNTPLDFLLEGANVALDLLYVSLDLPFPETLPDHDVLFFAIGLSDGNIPLLEQAGRLVQLSPRPVLNRPDRIAGLSRENVSALLKSVPGAKVSISARINRDGLQQICRGEKPIGAVLEDGDFPAIVRPVDMHGGKGLTRIDEPGGIAAYLEGMAENEFHIARFVDYRSPDGLYRKYRVALIEGRPFACHMAISENWMIHYKNAGMSESAAKRAEEERFMSGFDAGFALRHKDAFRAIGERIGLDYLVIDCGETPDGELLVFEADNVGFVHAMDPVEIFPYKQPLMRKVFDAFHGMLRNAMPLSLPGAASASGGDAAILGAFPERESKP